MLPSRIEEPQNNSSPALIGLPDEILLQVLGYLNQIDAIQLSLTCMRFKEVTRQRLYKVIHVYNKGRARIPKDYYSAHYTNSTQMSWNTFSRMIGDESVTPLCKIVSFQNDHNLDVANLEILASVLELCVFVIYRIAQLSVQRWILKQKDPSRVHTHYISSPTKHYMEDDGRIHVKHLTIVDSDEISLEKELRKYDNLSSLYIKYLRDDTELQRISVRKLKLLKPTVEEMSQVFKCFDVGIITLLDLAVALDDIVALAPRFKSLRTLKIKKSSEILVDFAICLPENSLMYLAIPNTRLHSMNSMLLCHRLSLREIICGFQVDFLFCGEISKVKRKFGFLKMELWQYPNLQYVRFDAVALKAVHDEKDIGRHFSPVKFHD